MRRALPILTAAALASGAASAQQQPGTHDLGPAMERLLAPLQPQRMTLRPVARPLSALLSDGWEVVAASHNNAGEMYLLRRGGRHVRCLLLPTDVAASRPERLSLCAALD
jgi:hypothetical protein